MIISNSTFEESLRRVARLAKINRGSSKASHFSEFVLITFDPGQSELNLMCAGDDMQAHVSLPVMADRFDEDPFTVCVLPFTILEHLAKINSQINFSADSDKFVMKFSKGTVSAKSHKDYINQFYNRDDKEDTFFNGKTYATINYNSLLLKDILRSVVHAASGNTLDTQLVTFKSEEESLSVVATDSYRACFYHDIARTETDFEVSLHNAAIYKIVAMLSDEERDIQFVLRPDKISIIDGNFRAHFLTSRDGKDMWRILAMVPSPEVVLNVDDMKVFGKAIRFIRTFSRGGNTFGGDAAMTVEFQENSMRMHCDVSDKGDTDWEVDANYTTLNTPMKVGVNPAYIAQYLTHMKPKEFSMSVSDVDKPITLKSERDNLDYIIMPMIV